MEAKETSCAPLRIRKIAREARQQRVLAAYVQTCSVTRAVELAGIARRTHCHWLESNEEYRAAFQVAQQQAIDALEDEAMRRAKDGTEKPITVAGKREVIREYSDLLAIFLLKALRPEKYRDRQVLDIPQLGELTDRLAAGRRRATGVQVVDGPARPL